MPKKSRAVLLADAAKRADLRFPEPFYWTTQRLKAVEAAAPDFGADVFDAKPLATFDPGVSSIDFVVDGDSWFNHPLLEDVLDWFNEEKVIFAGAFMPGRILAEMVHQKRYQGALQAFAIRAVMLSGGGNDLISWKKQANGASPIFQSATGSDPAAYIDTTELTAAVNFLEGLLTQYAKDVRAIKPGVPIITHCYDWIIPKDYALAWPFNYFESG